MKNYFLNSLNEHLDILKQLVNFENKLVDICKLLKNTVNKSGKILICGNGGSAADSQHFAAELIGRFEFERDPISAISLTTDSSIITSISNDYNYSEIFSRQIKGLANEGDCLICFSTSGNSSNVINALRQCKINNIKTIGLLGNDGGVAKRLCDECLIIPSNNTARIQEAHIFIVHMICGILEQSLNAKKI